MKKIFIIIFILWLGSLLFSTAVFYYDNNDNKNYRVNINRIQERLNSSYEEKNQLVENLNEKEMGAIFEIDIVDYKKWTPEQKDLFFTADNTEDHLYIYRAIADSSFLVKYSIDKYDNKDRLKFLYINILITFLFVLFLLLLIYIYREIFKPVKEMSEVPERLSAGNIEKLNLPYKNKYIRKFIWGLDMLGEKLKEEKNRNLKLEKDRKTLVAGLSHDIRTPLSSIKNYAIALKENIYHNEEAKKRAFDVIIDKTETIEKISKELLDSSLKEINAKEIDVKKEELYLKNIAELLDKIVEQRIELLHINYDKEKQSANPLVKADLDALAKVFENIIENAVKYGDLKKIKVKYEIEEYYQLISIENSGSKIPESEIKHIFSSYYRGSNVKDKEGFGLGLYISKKIMQLLEGDIYAENTDIGVKFVLVFKMVV